MFVFIVCQVKGYKYVLKLRTLAFASYNPARMVLAINHSRDVE